MEEPVLLIGFRRAETTRLVLDAIRQAKPKTLFFATDGPRADVPGEEGLCAAVRALTGLVDWECNIKTDFSEVNLGCRRRVETALDWVFTFTDSIIVLEDDCVPTEPFFTFCDEMLELYRNVPNVMLVTGSNYMGSGSRPQGSYCFSHYPITWGWATWRRAWVQYYDWVPTWPQVRESGVLRHVFDSPAELRYWIKQLDSAWGSHTIWDYWWFYTLWVSRGLAVCPTVNLVSNIGFGENATHTFDAGSRHAGRPTEALRQGGGPPALIRDRTADELTFRHFFAPPWWSPVSRCLPPSLRRALKEMVRRGRRQA